MHQEQKEIYDPIKMYEVYTDNKVEDFKDCAYGKMGM